MELLLQKRNLHLIVISYGWYYCADILTESRRKENYFRTERKYGAADAVYALMGACDSSGALSGAVSRP